MSFLTRPLIGGIPTWVVIIIVGAGGLLFYLWFKNRSSTNSANQAQSASGLPGANQNINPLNPTNDPNIDPNTGVPYQLESMIDPNTGIPYYYENQSGGQSPTQSPPSPPPPVQPRPPMPPIPPVATQGPFPPRPPSSGGVPLSTLSQYYGLNPGQFANEPPGYNWPTFPVGGGPGSGTFYTFQPVGGTGQTAPLSHVAQTAYGVRGTSQTSYATQHIINANPSLQGKPANYQPPAGTKIMIPAL